MQSIIQADREHCFLCGMNRNLEPLDCHHVFSGINRKWSEKYGLTVYLHHSKCHIFGRESVHVNTEVRAALQAVVQKRAMEYYGWTIEQWLEIFGRSFL